MLIKKPFDDLKNYIWVIYLIFARSACAFFTSAKNAIILIISFYFL